MQTVTKTKTGAQIIIQTLNKLGIDTIFGYPGGIILNLYDELSKQQDIKHYLMRHEQSACHSAEGYAKVSGKCGVVLVTSGPGATNIVTGLANAYHDGTPIIAITGQVSSELLNKNSFQEVNIIDITRSCTKAGFQIKHANDISKTFTDAYKLAMSDRKGPVVVDITKNVFSELAEMSNIEGSLDLSKESYDEKDIIKVALSIKNSMKPVIIAGQGASVEDVKNISHKMDIPVVNTLMSNYPIDDCNNIGMVGIFGMASANRAIIESDLVIAIGTRLNDRITCCFNQEELYEKLIRIDINKSTLIGAKLGIAGHSEYILKILNSYLKEKKYTSWIDYLKKIPDNLPLKRTNKLHSFEVMEEIKNYFGANLPLIATEVGQHQVWAVRYLKNGSNFITSGGLGTMGFGLPAAIGASIANGYTPIMCVSGDGSFQMNMQELAVCVDYKIPVKILIMNNSYLGMVRQYQENSCNGRYFATKISSPDFIKLAESYGIKGFRIDKLSDVKNVIDKAFSTNGPVIIDCRVEEMELL